MNTISLDGYNDLNSDRFRIGIAMEPGSNSALRIYNSGGVGILEYSTTSDYIYSLKRLSNESGIVRDLAVSQASFIGYPSGLSWVPGESICAASDSPYIDERVSGELSLGLEEFMAQYGSGTPHRNRIPALTPKANLSDAEYIKDDILIPAWRFNYGWIAPTRTGYSDDVEIGGINLGGEGYEGLSTQKFQLPNIDSLGNLVMDGKWTVVDINMKVVNINSIYGALPYIEKGEDSTLISGDQYTGFGLSWETGANGYCSGFNPISASGPTGVFNIYTSSQKGSIFTMDLIRDFNNGSGAGLNPQEMADPFWEEISKIDNTGVSPIYSASTTKNALKTEWNSIFGLTANANAYSKFKDGTNVDEAFYDIIEKYITINWYGKMEEHLWGSLINRSDVTLNTRNAETLKSLVLYQLYYFGASDDIYNLALRAYPDYRYVDAASHTDFMWHIGVGGVFANGSDVKRSLIKEVGYLDPIQDFVEISQVVGLAPRTSYSYMVQNNSKLSTFEGLNK